MALEILNRTPEQVEVWLEFYGYRTLLDMQHGYGLEPTGVLDEETAKAMDAPCCGATAEMRRGAGLVKWDKHDLSIRVATVLPGFSRADYESVVLTAARTWTEVCDLRFALVPNGGDIVVSHKRIDGAGRTLAYAYFPNGGQLPLVMDSSERWKFDIDPMAVLAHEIGHTLGIDHDPDGTGLMAAFYNAKIKKPQPGYDTRQSQSRYGPPVAPPPPVGNEYLLTVTGLQVEGYTLVKNR